MKTGLFFKLYKILFKRNLLREGQIYTLNDGETYDIIRKCWEDGSGGMCYDIVLMKDIINEKTGKIDMHGGGYIVEEEDGALDEIRERGVLVGQLGVTHFFNKENGYRLRKIDSLSYFIMNFMEIYSFKPQQMGKKCCKYCRHYKTKLSAQETEALKKEIAFFTKYLGGTGFSICKIASKMIKKVIEDESENTPVVTIYSGCCRLFRLSVLRIIFNLWDNKK